MTNGGGNVPVPGLGGGFVGQSGVGAPGSGIGQGRNGNFGTGTTVTGAATGPTQGLPQPSPGVPANKPATTSRKRKNKKKRHHHRSQIVIECFAGQCKRVQR